MIDGNGNAVESDVAVSGERGEFDGGEGGIVIWVGEDIGKLSGDKGEGNTWLREEVNGGDGGDGEISDGEIGDIGSGETIAIGEGEGIRAGGAGDVGEFCEVGGAYGLIGGDDGTAEFEGSEGRKHSNGDGGERVVIGIRIEGGEIGE